MSEKKDFLTFSDGIGNERWARMGQSLNLRRWYTMREKCGERKCLKYRNFTHSWKIKKHCYNL